MQKKVLLNANQIDIIINRLVCQLIENHHDFSNTVLVGLQPRGIYLLEKILNVLSEKHADKKITSGNLDYTFFRDDFINSKIDGKILFKDDFAFDLNLVINQIHLRKFLLYYFSQEQNKPPVISTLSKKINGKKYTNKKFFFSYAQAKNI